ncbi:MAG TPA: methenyltetrahydrofolate cyclohydrolase [Firmicutes bacterium]|nr:methenyltetrahydrofolate cyclohydrolase [Bacillota bacterium]
MLRNKTIDEFLRELAGEAPTPGGGSVAALNGALGCALLEMVCNLTIGKEKFQDVWLDLEPVKTDIESLREELTDSIDRDAKAYDLVTAAFKMPKGTPEEKEARKDAIQSAMKAAAETPKATARYIHQALKHAKLIAEKGNPNVLSDAGTGALCLKAGLHAALMNIAINLGGIKDEAYVHQMKQEIEFLKTTCDQLADEVVALVRTGIGLE